MSQAPGQCDAADTETNPANRPGQPHQPKNVDAATTQQIRLPIQPRKRTVPHGATVVEKPVWRAEGLPQVRMSRSQLCTDLVIERQGDPNPNHQCRQDYNQEYVHDAAQRP